MPYLIAAYIVLWAISFGLLASIFLRQRRLEADLRAIRDATEDRDGAR